MDRILPYLYLLRVPLLGWLVVTLLAPLSVNPDAPLNAMVGGMFDLSWWGTFWVALAGALASTTFGVCALMTFHAGWKRAEVPAPSGLFSKPAVTSRLLGWTLEWGVFAVGAAALLALASLIWGVLKASGDPWSRLAPCALAASVFFGLFALGALMWRASFGPLLNFAAQVVRFTPAGYLDEDGHLLPGHGFAAAMTSLFLLVYVACGLFTWMRLQGPVDPWVDRILPNPPTLAFFLILVSLWVWILSAVTFFFDRFRVPIVAAFALYVLATSQTQRADHHFAVSEAKLARVSPREVIGKGGGTPIIICASGGGIQAGAWTAKVLRELDREFPTRFASSVRLISAVSGGSVGAMYFAAAQGEGRPGDAFDRAVRSSLYAVGWGAVYPDFARVFFPPLVPKTIDRGWAIERAWNLDGRLPNRLGDWREDVKSGRRPALLLNATIIETGQRLVFPTFDFKSDSQLWRTKPPRTFYDLYGEAYDLPLTTAVRLSATFPYVTPVARADADLPQGQRYHFADGGYYDNFGVSSAINFLDLAYAGNTTATPRNVLLIEIRDSRDSVRRAEKGQGWLFQFTAPLDGITNVRNTAQRERNNSEIAILRDALAHRGVTLHHAEFEGPRGRVPLSWHLTEAQIAAFREDWDGQFAAGKPERRQVDAVSAFLDGGAKQP